MSDITIRRLSWIICVGSIEWHRYLKPRQSGQRSDDRRGNKDLNHETQHSIAGFGDRERELCVKEYRRPLVSRNSSKQTASKKMGTSVTEPKGTDFHPTTE